MAATAAAVVLHGVVFLGPEPASMGNVVRIYPNGGHVLLFDAATALLNAIFQDLGLYRLRWGSQGWHALYAEFRYPADVAALHGHVYLVGHTLLLCVRVHESCMHNPNQPLIGPIVQLI